MNPADITLFNVDERVFLFSSLHDLPDRYFMGHAFAGSDLVVGKEGAAQYLRHTGKVIAPGEDGCYLTIERGDTQHVIGTDFCGNTALFIYRSGERWAVSNSIVELIDFAKRHSLPLTVDLSQIESWHIPGSFGSQLASHKTVANEICLLPSSAYLVAKNGALTVHRRAARPCVDYQEALRRFLSRWTGRAATVASDNGSRALVDLTGGIDSRTVGALFIRTGRELHQPNIEFRSGKAARQKSDLMVAQRLARKYDLVLNRTPKQRTKLVYSNPYRRWKSLCLGAYRPIYLPSPVEADAVFFTGGGGGAHRPFYSLVTPFYALGPPESYVELKRKYFRSNRLFRPWREAVLNSFREVEGLAPDPLIGHYREFRNRLHAGRQGTYKTAFAPLASRDLFDCTAAPDAPDVVTRQVFFDVMQNLCPGLMVDPYDESKKAPTPANLDNVTLVDFETVAGRVFRGRATNAVGEDSVEPARCLSEEFSAGLKKIPNNLLQPWCVEEASAQIAKLDDHNGKFPVASAASPVHHVILAGLVSEFLTEADGTPSDSTEGHESEELSHAQEEIDLYRNDPLLSYRLGILLKKAGEITDAALAFERAIELRPNFANAHRQLSMAYAGQDRQADALAAAQGAIACKPEDAKLHYHLGNLLRRWGNFDQAIAAFERALELRPDFADAHRQMSTTYVAQDRRADALAAARRAIACKPEDAELQYNLGMLLKRWGDLDQAISAFERAVELKPDFDKAHQQLGCEIHLPKE